MRTELTASDPARADAFGRGTDIYGDTVVVGAPWTDYDVDGDGLIEELVGTVYVFVRDGDGWVEQARLESPDGDAVDFFGLHVAIHEDTLVAGAHNHRMDLDNSGTPESTGAVYVFVREGATWRFQQKLIHEGGRPEFATNRADSLGIYDDTIVVGAPSDRADVDGDGFTETVGTVHVFERNGETWSRTVRLTADDADRQERNNFGLSAAISGDTIVASASNRVDTDMNGSAETDFRAAYVFVRDGGGWAQQAKLVGSDIVNVNDRFGFHLDVSGDTLVAGADGESVDLDGDGTRELGTGRVYVFEREGTNWAQVAALVSADAQAAFFLGKSVAIDGDTFVAGAVSAYEDDIALDPGAAYVFQRSGGVWTEVAKLADPDGLRNDEFGISTGIYRSTAVVGAHFQGVDLDGDGEVEDDGTSLIDSPEDQVGIAHVFDSGSALFASVLPTSRSVVIGATATAFATIVNTGSTTATNCGIALSTNLDADFFFQTTDASNLPTGTRDARVDIAGDDGLQSFFFGITPNVAIDPVEVEFSFQCDNMGRAPIFPGVNTLQFSASRTPVADIIALALTPSEDGIVVVSPDNNFGLFAVATSNVGAAADITVSAESSNPALPLVLTLCETGAAGICVNGGVPQGEVNLPIAASGQPTFSVFAQATGPVPFNPQTNRINLLFRENGAVRGSTSVAVRFD